MEISIIIPTFNRNQVLYKHLERIYHELKGYDHEVIVVNDSSSNEVVIPEHMKDKVRQVRNTRSGVASARNYGAALARGRWLLFLDDDMVLDRKNFDTYLTYCSGDPNICVNLEWSYPPVLLESISKKAFGRFLIRYGFTSMNGWYNGPNWGDQRIIVSEALGSANLLINKNVFAATGGYDENFPFAGFEDYAFFKRLEKSHLKFLIDRSSMMYHNEEDRVEAEEWFMRKERGGRTRRIAVAQGFGDVAITHNSTKRCFYALSPILRPLIAGAASIMGHFRFLDKLTFACYKALLGIAINKGYHSKT